MGISEEIGAIEAVSRAVDRIKRVGRGAEFELSNGIVLSLKPVPPLLIQAVSQEFKMPDPPKVYMEEKGRDEPNPNDPEYLKELVRINDLHDMATNDMLLGLGSTVKSVPEGYFLPESDEWIAQVQFAAGIAGKELKIDQDDKIKRYLCWLRLYAMETSTDAILAQTIPLHLGGITEGEIDEAVESFRSVPERGTNPEPPTPAGNQNGHTANRANRRNRSRN